MRYLLDTHLLVWASESQQRLPAVANELMADRGNELIFSAASLWEIAIKSAQGKKEFQVDAGILRRGLIRSGYQELAITSEHAISAAALPSLHKDPFDRLLIAQAAVEGIVLLTADRVVAQYPGPIQQV